MIALHIGLISVMQQHELTITSVQSLIRVRLFATPCTAARQVSHHQLPELAQTHVHRVGNAIQSSHPHSREMTFWEGYTRPPEGQESTFS